MEYLEIWQPRYKDNTVLIAEYKVRRGKNIVKFTKAKHLAGMTFEVSSDVICSSPLDSNGRIPCYAVPFDKLKRID